LDEKLEISNGSSFKISSSFCLNFTISELLCTSDKFRRRSVIECCKFFPRAGLVEARLRVGPRGILEGSETLVDLEAKRVPCFKTVLEVELGVGDCVVGLLLFEEEALLTVSSLLLLEEFLVSIFI